MIELRVNDMTCGHCVSAVTRAVKSVDPEAEVQVDLEGKRVRVEGQSSADALSKALEQAGYPATPVGERARGASAKHGCCA